MPVLTKRWNDPRGPEDGFRLLICRIRPRGVSKAHETWDEWWADLGPTRALLSAFQGKGGQPAIDWETYSSRYLQEIARQTFRVGALVSRVAAGETITLLCSSACTNPERCHRTLLARVVEHGTRAGARSA